MQNIFISDLFFAWKFWNYGTQCTILNINNNCIGQQILCVSLQYYQLACDGPTSSLWWDNKQNLLCYVIFTFDPHMWLLFMHIFDNYAEVQSTTIN